ncbi:MAG: hypothetical protein ABI823_19755, partial [Bryobacteraceae bacterium]
PGAIATQNLFPVFAPASFFERGGWPGPYAKCAAPGVGLTWAIALPHHGMRYIDFGISQHWTAANVDWKAIALENLRKASRKIYTHGMGRLDGSPYAVAMMHTDGWGPSRLLLGEGLQKLFPEGYRVAIPEMSCGFAISNHIDAEQEDTIHRALEQCYKHGTRPLAPGIFDASAIVPDLSGA